MNIKDVLNPWGQLADARKELIKVYEDNRRIGNELLDSLAQRDTDRKEYDLGRRLLRAEIERLEGLVKNGHFRNPKTGRLGRKGERFK